jgi:hypothetical protein
VWSLVEGMLGDFYTLFVYCVFVYNSINKYVHHQQFSVSTFFPKVMSISAPHFLSLCVFVLLLNNTEVLTELLLFFTRGALFSVNSVVKFPSVALERLILEDLQTKILEGLPEFDDGLDFARF